MDLNGLRLELVPREALGRLAGVYSTPLGCGMCSSQGTSGSVFSTVLVVCRLWHATSESSVVSME